MLWWRHMYSTHTHTHTHSLTQGAYLTKPVVDWQDPASFRVETPGPTLETTPRCRDDAKHTCTQREKPSCNRERIISTSGWIRSGGARCRGILSCPQLKGNPTLIVIHDPRAWKVLNKIIAETAPNRNRSDCTVINYASPNSLFCVSFFFCWIKIKNSTTWKSLWSGDLDR